MSASSDSTPSCPLHRIPCSVVPSMGRWQLWIIAHALGHSIASLRHAHKRRLKVVWRSTSLLEPLASFNARSSLTFSGHA